MTKFEKEYFQKMIFAPQMIKTYLQNARRDLEISQKDPFAEVQFTYAYQAMIKIGIVLIAYKGQVRIRSLPGHHLKIIEQLSKLLDEQDVYTIGNAMRKKRNHDLYQGGEFISKKEAKEYAAFVAGIFKRVERILKKLD